MTKSIPRVPPFPALKDYDRETAAEISRISGLSLNVARILARRGFEGSDDLLDFLNPRLGNLLTPDGLKDFTPTIERIVNAVGRNETVGVFGDYDMDGIGSAAMWTLFFRAIALPCHTLIAHRNSGYGLDTQSVDAFRERGVSLIIACDVGSTDYASADYAAELGVDLIIIDHHHIEAPWPTAHAIINPQRADSHFPYLGMATVGLTFYTIAGLRTRLLQDGYRAEEMLPDVRDYLDIVAMGTLADVAPLTDVNRIMVSYGLDLLRERKRTALKALFDLSKLTQAESINEKSVVFRIVPKLNAPGRMGDPTMSLDLLLAQTYDEAYAIARKLKEVNTQRQELQEKIYKEALEQASLSLDYRWGVVVSSAGWHQGIVGIVAAKLAEHFKRPAVVVGLEGDRGRGSVRSYGNINIFKALEASKEHLLTFGGHPGAAGLEISISEIGNFAKSFDKALSDHHSDAEEHHVRVDGQLTLDEVSPELISELESLAPFGNANPEPILYSDNVEVVSARYPRGVHLSLILRDPVTKLTKRAIGFNMGKVSTEVGQVVNIIYVPERDSFRGGNAVQLRLLHIWS